MARRGPLLLLLGASLASPVGSADLDCHRLPVARWPPDCCALWTAAAGGAAFAGPRLAYSGPGTAPVGPEAGPSAGTASDGTGRAALPGFDGTATAADGSGTAADGAGMEAAAIRGHCCSLDMDYPGREAACVLARARRQGRRRLVGVGETLDGAVRTKVNVPHPPLPLQTPPALALPVPTSTETTSTRTHSTSTVSTSTVSTSTHTTGTTKTRTATTFTRTTSTTTSSRTHTTGTKTSTSTTTGTTATNTSTSTASTSTATSSTTETRTTVPNFDCDAGLDFVHSWTLLKVETCCMKWHGSLLWRARSDKHCCGRRDGCPKARRPEYPPLFMPLMDAYDCVLGSQDFMRLWSAPRQAWCCANKHVGCTSTTQTTTRTTATTSTRTSQTSTRTSTTATTDTSSTRTTRTFTHTRTSTRTITSITRTVTRAASTTARTTSTTTRAATVPPRPWTRAPFVQQTRPPTYAPTYPPRTYPPRTYPPRTPVALPPAPTTQEPVVFTRPPPAPASWTTRPATTRPAAPTSPPGKYDCFQGLFDPSAWRADKVDWCCTFHHLGCSKAVSDLGAGGQQASLPQRPLPLPAAGGPAPGAPAAGDLYDCQSGLAEAAWSFEKAMWCCETKNLGCNKVTDVQIKFGAAPGSPEGSAADEAPGRGGQPAWLLAWLLLSLFAASALVALGRIANRRLARTAPGVSLRRQAERPHDADPMSRSALMGGACGEQ